MGVGCFTQEVISTFILNDNHGGFSGECGTQVKPKTYKTRFLCSLAPNTMSVYIQNHTIPQGHGASCMGVVFAGSGNGSQGTSHTPQSWATPLLPTIRSTHLQGA